MSRRISDGKISIVDRLLGNKKEANRSNKTIEEERENLLDKSLKMQAKSNNDFRAYSIVDPQISNRTPDFSSDNREEIIRKASEILRDKIEAFVGKGGVDVQFDGIDVKSTSSDPANNNIKYIDEALTTFAINVSTPTKPVILYGAVEYNEFGPQDKDNPRDRFRVANRFYSSGGSEIKANSESLNNFFKSGLIKESNYKLDRKLVLFDIEDENKSYYAQLDVKDINIARAKLCTAGFRVDSKVLGREYNINGPVYEVIALPSEYVKIKRILAQEWKDYDRRPHNDEDKAWTESSNTPGDFSGRSLEKNPAAYQRPEDGPIHQQPHEDEDKAQSDESEDPYKHPGRAHEKNKMKGKEEIGREVKNDEFDGHHSEDARSETHTEFPGRSLEGLDPEKGEASPRQLLRYERKKEAQGNGPEADVYVEDPDTGNLVRYSPATGEVTGVFPEEEEEEVPMRAPTPRVVETPAGEAVENLPGAFDELGETSPRPRPAFGMMPMPTGGGVGGTVPSAGAPVGVSTPAPAAGGSVTANMMCSGCGYQTSAREEKDCPKCGLPLKMHRETDEREEPRRAIHKDYYKPEVIGYRVASWINSLVEKGHKVHADCFCKIASCACGKDGCDNCFNCCYRRGVAIIAQKNSPGTYADNLTAQSQPSPEGFPAPDEMDGMAGYGDTGPKVVPSERASTESQARRAQKECICKCDCSDCKDGKCKNCDCSCNCGNKKEAQMKCTCDCECTDCENGKCKECTCKCECGKKEEKEEEKKEAYLHYIKEAKRLGAPNKEDAHKFAAYWMQKDGITTSGIDNPDEPPVALEHNPMDGMDVSGGNEAPLVSPSEEAGPEQEVPGITKNPSHPNIDESQIEPNDGMGDRPEHKPPTNSGATNELASTPYSWSPGKKGASLKLFKDNEDDEKKSPLTPGNKTLPYFSRIYAQKKKAQKAYNAKRSEVLLSWQKGLIDLDECNKRVALLDGEKKKVDAQLDKEDQKECTCKCDCSDCKGGKCKNCDCKCDCGGKEKKEASDLGRDNSKGGSDADKQKGREKYHQDESTKLKINMPDKDWFDRSREKLPWREQSRNWHPTLKGDEGKERSDETESESNWAGRSREKNDDESVSGLDKAKPDARDLSPANVGKDEDRAKSEDSEKPDEFPGRAHEKRKSDPSKEAKDYMWRSEQLDRLFDDEDKKEKGLDLDKKLDLDREDRKPKRCECGCREGEPCTCPPGECPDEKYHRKKKEDKDLDLDLELKKPFEKRLEGAGEFVNARKRQAEVPGAGKETSYYSEGKADLSTNMPSWEYDADEKLGRSDQAQDVQSPIHMSENVDQNFYEDGKYLSKSSGTATRDVKEQSDMIKGATSVGVNSFVSKKISDDLVEKEAQKFLLEQYDLYVDAGKEKDKKKKPKCSHTNPDGTFKGGFKGCVAHQKSCGNKSEESAKKICAAIKRRKYGIYKAHGGNIKPLVKWLKSGEPMPSYEFTRKALLKSVIAQNNDDDKKWTEPRKGPAPELPKERKLPPLEEATPEKSRKEYRDYKEGGGDKTFEEWSDWKKIKRTHQPGGEERQEKVESKEYREKEREARLTYARYINMGGNLPYKGWVKKKTYSQSNLTKQAQGKSMCGKCNRMLPVSLFEGKSCRECIAMLSMPEAESVCDVCKRGYATSECERCQREFCANCAEEGWSLDPAERQICSECASAYPTVEMGERALTPEEELQRDLGRRGKKRTAIDHDRIPADIRRHRIDQHVGRVHHVGHPFKGNDVVTAPNDHVYQDLQEGRKPHGSTPYSLHYFVDKAFKGLRYNYYWDGNNAYKGICASEEARWMSPEQKIRLAELLRGYGLAVDKDIVDDCLKEDNEIESLHRQNTGDIEVVS